MKAKGSRGTLCVPVAASFRMGRQRFIFVLLAVAITGNSTQEAWIDHLRTGDRLMMENRHPEAERAYIMAQQEAEKLGADELPMAITLSHLASQHHSLGRLWEAGRDYAAALVVVERKVGPASHSAVRLAIGLSSVYLELNQVSRAETLLRKFLERINEFSMSDRATLLADLASVLVAKHRFEDAESLFQQALALFQRDQSQEVRERMAIALSNLSTLYVRMGRIAEGRAYSDRAGALLGMMTDPPPLTVLRTMANAAAISAKTGTPEETESLFQSAISFCAKRFGPNYYLLGYLMNNYSEFLRKVNRGAEARRARKQAKAILENFSKENLLGHTVDVSPLRE